MAKKTTARNGSARKREPRKSAGGAFDLEAVSAELAQRRPKRGHASTSDSNDVLAFAKRLIELRPPEATGRPAADLALELSNQLRALAHETGHATHVAMAHIAGALCSMVAGAEDLDAMDRDLLPARKAAADLKAISDHDPTLPPSPRGARDKAQPLHELACDLCSLTTAAALPVEDGARSLDHFRSIARVLVNAGGFYGLGDPTSADLEYSHKTFGRRALVAASTERRRQHSPSEVSGCWTRTLATSPSTRRAIGSQPNAQSSPL